MACILHLGKFSHRHMGGIETVVDSLLDGLSAFFQLAKIVANDRFKLAKREKASYLEVSVPLIGLVARTPLCPTLSYHIKRLHQHYQFSIVHLHFPNPMAHFASQILPPSVKRVVSWHSDIIQQKKLLRIYQPFVNRLLEKTSALIVATDYLASASLQISTARQRHIIKTIPYGIALDNFVANKPIGKISRLRQQFINRFIVFALGRHVTYKGFSYLIESMIHLPTNIVLFLGGSGPLTAVLKRQVERLKLENRVFFLGKIDKDELPLYYHACDVFCLPSIEQNEAFGMVILEAMACSKPVVSCDLGRAGSDINKDGMTGLVVPPRSATLLAKAIEKLYREPGLRCNLGHAAYQHVSEKYSNQRMIQQVRDLYQEILQNR